MEPAVPFEANTEQLDRIWQNYQRQFYGHEPRWFTEQHYIDSRRSTKATKFEDWLFEHGARVFQRNQKRHLRFYTEEQAVFLLLTYG